MIVVAFPRDKVSVGLGDRAEPCSVIVLPVVRIERHPGAPEPEPGKRETRRRRRESSRIGLLIKLTRAKDEA